MATNKQIKEVRKIVRKLGCWANIHNYGMVKELNFIRYHFNECELPYDLMFRELQDWLDKNPVSYKLTPKHNGDRFFCGSLIIE